MKKYSNVNKKKSVNKAVIIPIVLIFVLAVGAAITIGVSKKHDSGISEDDSSSSNNDIILSDEVRQNLEAQGLDPDTAFEDPELMKNFVFFELNGTKIPAVDYNCITNDMIDDLEDGECIFYYMGDKPNPELCIYNKVPDMNDAMASHIESDLTKSQGMYIEEIVYAYTNGDFSNVVYQHDYSDDRPKWYYDGKDRIFNENDENITDTFSEDASLNSFNFLNAFLEKKGIDYKLSDAKPQHDNIEYQYYIPNDTSPIFDEYTDLLNDLGFDVDVYGVIFSTGFTTNRFENRADSRIKNILADWSIMTTDGDLIELEKIYAINY